MSRYFETALVSANSLRLTLMNARDILARIVPEIDEEYNKAKDFHTETIRLRRADIAASNVKFDNAITAVSLANSELKQHDAMPWTYRVLQREAREKLVQRRVEAYKQQTATTFHGGWIPNYFPDPVHLITQAEVEASLQALRNVEAVTLTPEQVSELDFLRQVDNGLEACLVRWGFDLMNHAVRNRGNTNRETWPECRLE